MVVMVDQVQHLDILLMVVELELHTLMVEVETEALVVEATLVAMVTHLLRVQVDQMVVVVKTVELEHTHLMVI